MRSPIISELNSIHRKPKGLDGDPIPFRAPQLKSNSSYSGILGLTALSIPHSRTASLICFIALVPPRMSACWRTRGSVDQSEHLGPKLTSRTCTRAREGAGAKTKPRRESAPIKLADLPPNSPPNHPSPSVRSTASRGLSPPPPPLRDLAEERGTRVEISFERFEKVALRLTNPQITRAAIRRLSQSVIANPEWNRLVTAHRYASVDADGNDIARPDWEGKGLDLVRFITAHGREIEVDGLATTPLVWGKVDRPRVRTPRDSDLLYKGESPPLSAASFAGGKCPIANPAAFIDIFPEQNYCLDRWLLFIQEVDLRNSLGRMQLFC